MTTLKEAGLTLLKGMAMGGADIIPGVSGGTIAFITGIYERLINAIKSFDVKAIRLLFAGRLVELWQKLDGKFLLILLSGILLSIFSLAKLFTYLLYSHPVQLWSFFFGLIIISSFFVGKEVTKWNFGSGLALLAGVVIAYFITDATPSQTPNELWFIFLSGSIAICAMILPGISGSFILLIMGKYEVILSALKNFDAAVLITFALGAFVGILGFSRFISWLLSHYHNITVALLSGFMVGSLNKIWPWKEVISYRLNSSGEQVPFIEKNVLPTDYYQITGNEPHLFEALFVMGLGIFIVVFIELLSTRLSNTHA